MIIHENLDQCPPQQLREMLAEVQRAQKVFEANLNAPFKTVTTYYVNDQEVMALECPQQQDEDLVLELYYIGQSIQEAIDAQGKQV